LSKQDPRDESGWTAVALELPADLEGEIVGRLAAYSMGAVSAPAGVDGILLRIFFRSAEETHEAVEQARRFLGESGLDIDSCRLRTEEIEDRRWAERFQASLKPFPLGERFMIFPGGRVSASGARVPLLLVPSRAFGTGEHPTTRMCAGRLEQSAAAGGRWLDLGCGTAILSIVAHHCGAGDTLAIDNDPEAVAVAAEVLRANGLSGKIGLECATIEECEPEAWNGVVANIGAPFFIARAADVASRLAPGGILICSGFLVEDSRGVEDALSRAGLETSEHAESDSWAVIVAEKGGGRRR
jgi:ribosomal protein L11 methyltransferase